MTERVLGPTGSRSRTTRASLLLMALMGLVFGVLIGGGSFATAAKPGPASSTIRSAPMGKSTSSDGGCPKGWINGILNEKNSSYHEDQVTPQRLIVDFTSGGTHTTICSWLVRKADAHAYDSLGDVESHADGRRGVSRPHWADGAACERRPATPGHAAIPEDDLEVDSACTREAHHVGSSVPGQELQMFGLQGGAVTRGLQRHRVRLRGVVPDCDDHLQLRPRCTTDPGVPLLRRPPRPWPEIAGATTVARAASTAARTTSSWTWSTASRQVPATTRSCPVRFSRSGRPL